MKITFDLINGIVVPDGKLLDFSSEILDKKQDISIGSEVLVVAIRAMMIRKKIPNNEVIFVFNGEEITINKYYELSGYPVGFCDCTRMFLREILKFRCSSTDKGENKNE